MKNIKAIVFDAYGTLFDVNSAAEKCKNKIGDKWESFANYWRTTQLEYTWLRSLMKRHKDFWQVTEESLEKSIKTFKIDISMKTKRDFIPVNYFSDCLLKLMLKKCYGLYNISSGLGTTLEDFCNAIIKGYGGGGIVTIDGATIKDQFILDNQKLLSVVSFNIDKNYILQYATNIGEKLKTKQKGLNNV